MDFVRTLATFLRPRRKVTYRVWRTRLKKFSTGKKFSKSIFSFLNTFWTNLNRFRPKKIFFEKFSIFWSPIFRNNGYVPEKNFQREKVFKIDIFVLNHVLNHSKSIPTKNIFSKKFRFFWSFFAIFGPKKSIFRIFSASNFEKFYQPLQKDCIAVILHY